MDELFKVMGKYLQEKRVDRDLSQGEVASKLGYSSPQFISNIERGLCAPPLRKLRKLIDLYNLNGEEVMQLILSQQELHLRKSLGLGRFAGRRGKRKLDS
jgi:transcriptional regulator with XRE-family HTH domain